jgi:signal transduction histidine kinase
VKERSDGLGAIELAQMWVPDLILSDIQMPNLDGYQMLERLRGDSQTATVPVILMTGRADFEGMRHGMSLGADDYLPKPFSLSEMLEALEAQLQKRQIRKREAEQKLHSFTSHIALVLPHELLTPLNGILGFATLLRTDEGVLTRTEVQEFTQSLLDSAQRLHRLIQNFMIFAQIEILSNDTARSSNIRSQVTQAPARLIRKVAMAEAAKYQREMDLVLELSELPVAFTSDYLSKCVEELVGNAFQFSPTGTRVEVRFNEGAAGPTLSITNEGPGMSPAQVAQIESRAQFTDRIRGTEGAGLGLSIARGLVELHGARLRVSSLPGRTTMLTLVFQRASPPSVIPPVAEPKLTQNAVMA